MSLSSHCVLAIRHETLSAPLFDNVLPVLILFSIAYVCVCIIKEGKDIVLYRVLFLLITKNGSFFIKKIECMLLLIVVNSLLQKIRAECIVKLHSVRYLRI